MTVDFLKILCNVFKRQLDMIYLESTFKPKRRDIRISNRTIY